MLRARRRALCLTAVTLALSASACAATPQDIAADRKSTLSNYIESEKSAMRDFIATMDHIYSAGEVTGEFDGDAAGEQFPPVIVTFTYTYVEEVVFDHHAPGDVKPSWIDFRPEAELTAMQTQLLQACRSSVIPAMREGGLEGPLTVRYIYLNPGIIRDSWDATCSN